jgi:flavin-dependent dehydrogenase
MHDPRQWVIFEEDLLPGYAWVFPLPGGRANVGFALERDRHPARQAPGSATTGRRLKELWPALLQRPRIGAVLGPGATPEGAHRAWPIPASYDPARLGSGRVLYAGDAAAVVDPMTGEGIAQALETGILAGEAIAAGGDPTTVLVHYRRTVHRALGRDLRFASLLQRVLRAPLGARGAIRAAGLSGWTRRNFARWMFEDYPRALVLTPDRWRSGSFTPPGAFRQ